MGADHDHGHDHGVGLDLGPQVSRALRGAVGLLVLLTLVGLVVWRPDGGASLPSSVDGQGDRVSATVTGYDDVACDGVELGADGIACQDVRFDVTSGPNSGGTGSFQRYPQVGGPELEPGDRIVVNEYVLGDTGEVAYTFADYQRSNPLLLLGAIFVAAVVALGRWQGVRALLGLGVSGVVLVVWVFPALLDGRPALPVALVAASVIAVAALYLAHGVNETTTVALLGTMVALGLTGILGLLFTRAAQITGLASEDQIFLLVASEGVDIRGLVLAGMVLGSLGVLDDVTVTQVSSVARLREANPAYGVRELYTAGVRIGRDHIASTVNTLVLAYAGASLPLLLFYSSTGIGFSETVTSEIVAVEVIRTLVGSVGLVAAVPITTVLAAIVVAGQGRAATGTHDPTGAPHGHGAAESSSAPEPGEGPATDWGDFAPEERDF